MRRRACRSVRKARSRMLITQGDIFMKRTMLAIAAMTFAVAFLAGCETPSSPQTSAVDCVLAGGKSVMKSGRHVACVADDSKESMCRAKGGRPFTQPRWRVCGVPRVRGESEIRKNYRGFHRGWDRDDTRSHRVDPPVALHRTATCIRRASRVMGSCCEYGVLLAVRNNEKGVCLARA